MGRSGNSPLPPSSSLYSCINPAVECSQTRFHSRKHESASSQRSSTPIPHETGQEKNPGMGGGFSLGSRWTKAGCLSWCLEEGWIGLEVGGFSLTDIQYTQLMPLTGNSNIIICAGRSHIYYPICPTGGGGGGKYQHRRRHGLGQEFQNRYIGGTRGNPRRRMPKTAQTINY